jgi:aldehyde:ferredoxin oxidoreductase
VKDLDPAMAWDYLGGTGLSARLTFGMLSEKDYDTLRNDPFSPVNPLIFSTGPVTGTIRPSSGRYAVTGISPHTGIWGEGTSGGFFCVSLRRSGFDAIVITGKARRPVYLYLHDGIFEFRDAGSLWGRDTYESIDMVKKEIADDRARVAVVGPAAERLVKYAGIFNDEGRTAGRCGLGTLMASKNLKAFAVRGTGEIRLHDSTAGRELLRKAEAKVRSNFMKSASSSVMRLYGTNSYLDMGMFMGDTPGYYFTETEFLAEKLTGKTLREEYPVLDYGCAGCTLQCGKATIVEQGGETIRVDGPEYESVASLGPMNGVFDSKAVILASHLCNRYGMDTISCGVCISFLIYLAENGLGADAIRKHLSGIPFESLRWGNAGLLPLLIRQIAERRGIGGVLADGVRAMAKEFGVDPDLAAHVKGLEMPMHDPRAFAGQALSYATSPVGANHNKGDWFSTEIGTMSYARLGIKAGADRFSIAGRERGVCALQDLRAIDDAAVNCNFRNPPLDHIVGYINASTGFGYTAETLLLAGERINNLKRVINCRLGMTREDDRLPRHLTKMLTSGKTAGVSVDMKESLKAYYRERKWDWETGWPSREKLEELGIQA